MTITTRTGLGRPLTWAELDTNFQDVQSLKEQSQSYAQAAAASSQSAALSGQSALQSQEAAQAAQVAAEEAAQHAGEANERNVRVPEGETLNALPASGTRANNLVGFGADGNVSLTAISRVAMLDNEGVLSPEVVPVDDILQILGDSLSQPSGAAIVGYDNTISYGSGSIGEFLNKAVTYVTPEMFGGSDVTNSIVQAITAASALGVPLVCKPVDYPTTQAIIPGANSIWQANGCRVVATTNASTAAVKILNNNVTISGLLRISLSDPGGNPTAYRGHVLVGDWQDGSISPSGFRFDDIYLEGGHNNTNGFAVAGGANNIRGRSVKCGDNDKIGRLFMPHWGNFNDHYFDSATQLYQHRSGYGPTKHPNNIHVESIEAGNLTCNTTDSMAVFLVSGGYDITVGRIKGNVVNSGAGASDICLLIAGDLGFGYASSAEKSRRGWGIRIGSITGMASRGVFTNSGRAVYYNKDSTPLSDADYFAWIESDVGYIDGSVTNAATQPVAGFNGFGKTRIGVANLTGGSFCMSVPNYSTDVTVDDLRCNASFTKALQIAGSGGVATDWPQRIKIKRLTINGTASTGIVTQENSIGFLLQSCKFVSIDSIFINKLNTLGYVGAVRSNATQIDIGNTFIGPAYDSSLNYAYSITSTFGDGVSIGNVHGTTIQVPVSGGVTEKSVGRNKEYYSNVGFTTGLAVQNGDRVWITGTTGSTAMSQVTVSGNIGSTATIKQQLSY